MSILDFTICLTGSILNCGQIMGTYAVIRKEIKTVIAQINLTVDDPFMLSRVHKYLGFRASKIAGTMVAVSVAVYY